VRVRLLRYPIGLRALGSPPPQEAGDGDVEAVPEDVHGARLAAKPAGELLQRPVDPPQRLPEPSDGFTVIARVAGVLRERGRGPNLVGPGLDLGPDPPLREDCHEALVEVGDGEAVPEGEEVDVAPARAHDECVVDEVEGDVEVDVV
jgi:hypothetical protein